MDQEDVNEEFRNIAISSAIEDSEILLDQIITLEARSRYELGHNGDPKAAQEAADQAYALFHEASLRQVPTLVMALVDRFNQEHEAYAHALDHISDALGHLVLADQLGKRGALALAQANVDAATTFLRGVLEGALYAKGDGQ